MPPDFLMWTECFDTKFPGPLWLPYRIQWKARKLLLYFWYNNCDCWCRCKLVNTIKESKLITFHNSGKLESRVCNQKNSSYFLFFTIQPPSWFLHTTYEEHWGSDMCSTGTYRFPNVLCFGSKRHNKRSIPYQLFLTSSLNFNSTTFCICWIHKLKYLA